MNVAPRRGVALIAVSLLWGAPLGCHHQVSAAQGALAAATGSCEALKPKVARLQGTLAELHKGADALANEVLGGQEFRAKLLAADEVVGVTDARLKWLGGELEAARAAAGEKTSQEIADLTDQVAKSAAELAQVNAVAVDLLHEKARLDRVAALTRAPYERVLATGYRIKAATAGIEADLIDFVQGHKKIDRTTWFDFDRLAFAGEGSNIDFPKSRSQLENVVEILKAYPAMKLKIGGYTDGAAGPPARRKELSTDRAEAVRTALIQMGVAPARLTAEGYGAARPVCPADDTEFCRARNRRIAVQVVAAG